MPSAPARPRCSRRGRAASATRASCASRPRSSMRCSPRRGRPASGWRSTPSATGPRARCSTRSRAPARAVAGVPNDRLEHAQLLQSTDAPRFAALGVTASIQPIHAAADRDLVESCWDGRQDGAYAWRRLVSAGSLLAAGSDAPIESVNPWLGVFSAVHRRLPTDGRDDWRPAEALSVTEALAAYTRGAGGSHRRGRRGPPRRRRPRRPGRPVDRSRGAARRRRRPGRRSFRAHAGGRTGGPEGVTQGLRAPRARLLRCSPNEQATTWRHRSGRAR